MPFFGVPIRNGLPIGLGSVAGFGAPQEFSPSELFLGGTAGAWYDPSDLSTLFTTSAGTTQCAMPGLGSAVSVGLMLDKSQGLVLGPELVTNGDFSSGTTGWTAQASNNIAIVGGELEITLNSALFSGAAGTSYTLVPGKWYVATATARRGTSAANVTVRFGSGVGEGDLTFTTTSNVTQTRYFVATTTTTTPTVTTSSSSGSGTIYADNISIRELPGNHAIAFNNTTARPELRARVNLLTYSTLEGGGAAPTGWTQPVATGTSAPSGTAANGDIIYTQSAAAQRPFFSQNATLVAGTQYRLTCTVNSASGLTYADIIGNNTGETLSYFLDGVSVLSSASVSPGVVSITWSSVGGTTGIRIGIGVVGNATGSLTFRSPDLRPANIGANVPAYQRIADANTYDTSGFPLYLRFDGIDDSMYTPANLNLSGTDKVAVFAGVRKLSDAAAGALAELSANTSLNTGTFAAYAPGSAAANYVWRSYGTGIADVTATTFSAPITNVLTGIGNIGGDISQLRANGSVAGTNTGDQGTGNYGTYPLYIGARNNSSLWFNGHLHSLIIAGSAVSAGNISATEQWVAGKTGVVIP